jgi:oxygen-independent coproporphyrinogen-3 oxidase
MTGLRTIWGVSLSKIKTDFGSEILQEMLKNAVPFIEQGLLEVQMDTVLNKNLKTTKKGKFLADGIASDLFIV